MNKPARCVNCHFLVRNGLTLNGNSLVFVIDESERQSFRTGLHGQSASNVYTSYACHFGVWDEHSSDSAPYKQDEIMVKDRKDFCFFWPYHPGMLLPAAEVLQKREADNKAASQDRRLTLWGLWFAAGGLIVTGCTQGIAALAMINTVKRAVFNWSIVQSLLRWLGWI